MSLTCTNRDLMIAVGTQEFPGGFLKLSSLPIKNIKASFAITKAIRKVTEALGDVEKTRVKLLDQFAEKDGEGKVAMTEDGKAVKLKDAAGFQTAYQALLDEQVTLDGVRAVTLAELEGSGATPQDLLQSGPFVVEE
jgi:hypothetical protein